MKDLDRKRLQQQNSVDRLLDRPLPEGYSEEWTEILSREKEEERKGERFTVLVFRLGDEWYGLRTELFREVSPLLKLHSIPGSKERGIRGVANVRGRLQLCIDLHSILGQMSGSWQGSSAVTVYERMVVMELRNRVWVFNADEVHGIEAVEIDRMENAPVTVTRSKGNYLSALFSWKDRRVGILDADLLWEALKRGTSE